MSSLAQATDPSTGDQFQLYLGMNYTVPFNDWLTKSDCLPNTFTMRNIPTLVLPRYNPNLRVVFLFPPLFRCKTIPQKSPNPMDIY